MKPQGVLPLGSLPVGALTVAGFDPTGGAGLQADLKVFHAYGIPGLSVVSAITAQNTLGVEFVEPVGISTFNRQLEVLLDDIRPRSVKTGVIYSAAQVRSLAGYMKGYSLQNLVIDPVLLSSSGKRMVETDDCGDSVECVKTGDCRKNGDYRVGGKIDSEWLDAMKMELLPMATVFTPNMYEAGVFAAMEVHDIAGMKEAARRIASFGVKAVVVTGGHLGVSPADGLPAGQVEYATDVLYYKSTFLELSLPFLRGSGQYSSGFHGTGCTFSAAIAAGLALGKTVEDAIRDAKTFVNGAITRATYPGGGMGMLGV